MTITSRKLTMVAGLLCFVSALAMSGNVLAEEACATVPTCAELGYKETSCGAHKSLKCPFDKTKLFCGPCRSGYYDYSDETGHVECIYAEGDVVKFSETAVGIAFTYYISSSESRTIVLSMTDKGQKDWEAGKTACTNSREGGKKTWRLPTKDELMHIVASYKNLSVTLGLNGGDRLKPGAYWSQESDSAGSAWQVSVPSGEEYYYMDSATNYIRCVRDL